MDAGMISAINAISVLIKEMGTWPIGAILVGVLFGPWIFTLIINRAQEKRFENVKAMYENNVKLVESFDRLSKLQNEVVLLNTAKWSTVLDKIETNQFCPLARIRKRRMEDVDP